MLLLLLVERNFTLNLAHLVVKHAYAKVLDTYQPAAVSVASSKRHCGGKTILFKTTESNTETPIVIEMEEWEGERGFPKGCLRIK